MNGWAAGSTQSLTGASGGTVRFRVPRGVRAADTFALLALFRNKITGEIRAEVPAAEPELIGTCKVQSILRGDFYSTQWCEAEAHRTAGVSSTILVKYLGPPWTGGGQSIQEELSLDSPRLRNFVSAGGRCAGNLADVRRRRRPACCCSPCRGRRSRAWGPSTPRSRPPRHRPSRSPSGARKVLNRLERFKLAHAFLWELYGY